MSNEIEALKEAEQFSFSEQEKKSTKESKDSGGVCFGIILVLIGGGLLLTRFTPFAFHNWWALFFLIPVAASLGSAFEAFQKHGRLNEATVSALGGAIFMGFIASIFLFGLSWSLLWPLMLIFFGIGALAKASLT